MIIRRVKFEQHHRKVFFPTPRGVKNFWRHPYWRDTLHKQSQTCMFDEMMYQMDSNPFISKFFSHVWKVFYPTLVPKRGFYFCRRGIYSWIDVTRGTSWRSQTVSWRKWNVFIFEKSSIFWEIFEYGFGLWLTKW